MKHPRTAHRAPPSLARRYWPMVALCAAVTVIVAIASQGSDQLQVTITEMLIRMVAVVGIYMFIGNSGILSFGHIGFMCIGAYAAAWATVDPNWKQMMLTGLPDFLQQNQYGFLPDVAGGGLLAAAIALTLGAAIMRLSGIRISCHREQRLFELGIGHGGNELDHRRADRGRAVGGLGIRDRCARACLPLPGLALWTDAARLAR